MEDFTLSLEVDGVRHDLKIPRSDMVADVALYNTPDADKPVIDADDVRKFMRKWAEAVREKRVRDAAFNNHLGGIMADTLMPAIAAKWDDAVATGEAKGLGLYGMEIDADGNISGVTVSIA